LFLLSCVCLSVSVCLCETDLVRAVEAGKIDVVQTHWCTPVFSGVEKGANQILIRMVKRVDRREVEGGGGGVISLCTHLFILHMCLYICIYAYIYMYICIHVHMYICTYGYIFVYCICIYVHVCIHFYIYI